jgi:hypothetical protein
VEQVGRKDPVCVRKADLVFQGQANAMSILDGKGDEVFSGEVDALRDEDLNELYTLFINLQAIGPNEAVRIVKTSVERRVDDMSVRDVHVGQEIVEGLEGLSLEEETVPHTRVAVRVERSRQSHLVDWHARGPVVSLLINKDHSCLIAEPRTIKASPILSRFGYNNDPHLDCMVVKLSVVDIDMLSNYLRSFDALPTIVEIHSISGFNHLLLRVQKLQDYFLSKLMST